MAIETTPQSFSGFPEGQQEVARPISDENLAIGAISSIIDGSLSHAREVVLKPLHPHFYEADASQASEAERLRIMAQLADAVSLRAIGGSLSGTDVVIGDVGAGDSTSLGDQLTRLNRKVRYLPVDIRQEAVATHAAAGYESYVGSATDLPYADGSVDVLHSRFTFGWLDGDGRKRAIEEMVRAGADNARLAVIDYDWSVTDGPGPMNELVHKVTNLMESFGFDPNYGSKLENEFSQDSLLEMLTDTSQIKEQRTSIERPLGESMAIIESTVRPLIEKLQDVGMSAQADELSNLSASLRAYSHSHPEEMVRFPDIVSVSVDLQQENLHAEIRRGIETARSLGEQLLKRESIVAVGPPSLGTYYLTSPLMIYQGRRLHANAYREHNLVTDEALKKDGTLIEEIDPVEVTKASTYIGMFNGEGTVTAGAHIVETPDKAADGLPTVEKLRAACVNESDFAQLPFMQDGVASFEVSGLGKSGQNSDRTATAKILLSLWTAGKERGYDYAIMGVVESTANLLTGMFGEKAFKRINGCEDVVITGKGIREKGVKLVPFYVDVNTFVEDCVAHFDANPTKYSTKLHRSLFEAFR